MRFSVASARLLHQFTSPIYHIRDRRSDAIRISPFDGKRDVPDPVDSLILDLLEWIGPCPRPYSEVIDAWRTSCPRLPIWEEANERDLIERRGGAGPEAMVAVTPVGKELLSRSRPERNQAEISIEGQGGVHVPDLSRNE